MPGGLASSHRYSGSMASPNTPGDLVPLARMPTEQLSDHRPGSNRPSVADRSVRISATPPPVSDQTFMTEVRRLRERHNRSALGARVASVGHLCLDTPTVSSRIGSATRRHLGSLLSFTFGKRAPNAIDLRMPGRAKEGSILQGLTRVHNAHLGDMMEILAEASGPQRHDDESSEGSDNSGMTPRGGQSPPSKSLQSTFERCVQDCGVLLDARRQWHKNAEAVMTDPYAEVPPKVTLAMAEDILGLAERPGKRGAAGGGGPGQMMRHASWRPDAAGALDRFQKLDARRNRSPGGSSTASSRARGFVPGRLDTLRCDVEARRSFFAGVNDIRQRRAAATRRARGGGCSPVLRNVLHVGDWEPQRRQQYMEEKALAKAEYAAEVRERARARREARSAAAAALAELEDNRARLREEAEAEQERVTTQWRAWASFTCLALRQKDWLEGLLEAQLMRQQLAQANAAAEGDDQYTSRQAKLLKQAGTCLASTRQPPRSEQARKQAAKVLLKYLRRLVATKVVKRFCRDHLRAMRIPISVKVHREAVILVQRNWRELVMIRNWRRYICSLQVDKYINDLATKIDLRKEELERRIHDSGNPRNESGRSRATTMMKKQGRDEQSVEKVKEDALALMRERGELRSISNAVKGRLIHQWTRDKEAEFGQRIMDYLQLQVRVDAQIQEWVQSNTFVQPDMPAAQGRQRGRKPGSEEADIARRYLSATTKEKARLEKERALKGLRKQAWNRGDEFKVPTLPVFPLVSKQADVAELVRRAREESRRVIMERLAEDDQAVVSSWTHTAPAPIPARKENALSPTARAFRVSISM
eukprot:TRINITY_DN7664_c0_g1_i1.p1 TRINITY_DN7664_c0_g1~~TRINITY_DN7664_c0_g1_i1.p1  ORF type:complete len:851 (+),score=207.15 TRINITY_DN7664_c0_g1_i1:101-2554(+)